MAEGVVRVDVRVTEIPELMAELDELRKPVEQHEHYVVIIQRNAPVLEKRGGEWSVAGETETTEVYHDKEEARDRFVKLTEAGGWARLIIARPRVDVGG